MALLALAACAGDGEPSSAPSSGPPASATPTGVVTPTPTEAATPPPAAPTPTRDPLADLVEEVEVDEGEVLGADMSWPQCPPGLGIPQKRSSGQPMPVAEARYVVVGLTNGPGFYPNPCLADQVAWVRERRLMVGAYAVASYPPADRIARHGQDGPYDGSTDLGALANTGYQQALFNVRSMRAAGLTTPVVWVDVEPVPDFAWSSDRSANAAVVSGAARGYEDAGYRIGVYSTPLLWDGVVGDLELGVPEWRAAGQTSRVEARSRCGDDWTIQGGEAVLGQWVEADRDMNITCPGVSADLSAWFHQF
ncbi:hypothetical protein [Nocardioides litoris]|uniref:hypothetical protein n=1 Tax=Nocardioides litoris TaxID=1926648 RepID=UPI00112437A1|nr:hypothetical protein [Nocardioides litoris]